MIAIALGVLLLVPLESVPAATQDKPAAPPPSRSGRGLTEAEFVRRLDAYAIEQAQKALALTSSQFTAFAPRLRQYQELRRQHVQGRNKLLQQLRHLTAKGRGGAAEEEAIRAALTALREHDERAAAEVKRAYGELDEVLDLRQQARFRLFEQTLERRKAEMMMRARPQEAGERSR